ncbi:MAG: hypothetical protein JRF33_22135 [Deltaproteobacteria bacterium]|nr:hypothetical protein [Deltaproteobacteria bacterium]
MMPRPCNFGFFLALSCVLFLACEREPIEQFCPNVGVGELAISEIRGVTDAAGQWFELHNPNDTAVNLTGLSLRLAKLDGAGEWEIVLREQGLSLEPFGYFVLGRFNSDDLPSHVDYGYAADFDGDIYSAGFLQLYACETLIDQVIWGQDDNSASAEILPSDGTLSFDGAVVLTAESNDIGANWCYDEMDDGFYKSGTPKEMNRACEP